MSGFPIGRPRFVSTEEALQWHALAIAQDGGDPGLRDLPLLESALAQPRQMFSGEHVHDYPFGMAAAYAFHLSKNHPFVDGNKRIALLCCGGFLRMNGWNLVSDGEAAADAILSVVENRLDKNWLAEWLSRNCKARPSFELRDFLQAVPLERVIEHMKSSVSGQSLHELGASLDEASDAIPLIGSLRETADFLAQQGDRARGDHFITNALLLVALYRVAEDMGYEW